MKRLILSALILLAPVTITGSEFKPCPVYEHIQKYGAGESPVYMAEHKNKSKQLKIKNFKPQGR